MHSSKNYPLLLGSQFLSAFGDNVMIAVILGQLTVLRMAGSISEQEVNSANAIYNALFFIPFLVLAPIAGYINDRYPKTHWLLGGNAIKLLGALIGGGSVLLGHDWQKFGYAIVGIGACCYSPAKYGILPEILPGERLVKANGTVEMLTLGAILTGLFVGAKLADHLSLGVCYAIVLLIFGVSMGLNIAMTRTPCNPSARLNESASKFMGSLLSMLRNPRLGRILFGSGLFWLCGAALRTNLQSWGLEYLKASGKASVSNEELALLKLWLAVGIIVGSLIVGQFHKVGDLRGTRWYAWAMAGLILPLGLVTPAAGIGVVIALLIGSGIAAGFFLVPLNASLQAESDQSALGKTIAVQNFVDYMTMLIAAGFVWALSRAGLTASQIFIALAAFAAFLVCFLRIPPAKTKA